MRLRWGDGDELAVPVPGERTQEDRDHVRPASGFEIGSRRNPRRRTWRSHWGGMMKRRLRRMVRPCVINSTGNFVWRGRISCSSVAVVRRWLTMTTATPRSAARLVLVIPGPRPRAPVSETSRDPRDARRPTLRPPRSISGPSGADVLREVASIADASEPSRA
jgi:hypothetical protein